MDIGEVKAASFNKYFSVDEELRAIIGGDPACSYLRSSCVRGAKGSAEMTAADMPACCRLWSNFAFREGRS